MLLHIIRGARPSDPLYRRPSDPNLGISSNLSFFHRMGWGGSLPVAAAGGPVPLLTNPSLYQDFPCFSRLVATPRSPPWCCAMPPPSRLRVVLYFCPVLVGTMADTPDVGFDLLAARICKIQFEIRPGYDNVKVAVSSSSCNVRESFTKGLGKKRTVETTTSAPSARRRAGAAVVTP